MAVRIQVRRGTTTQWNNADPVLNEGEIGYNVTLASYKIGDGSSLWSELDYFPTMADLDTSLGDYIEISEKGVANGVAELDADGLVPASQIPNIAITSVNVVADEAARLALTAEPGDVAIQEDNDKTYILATAPASTNSNWKEIVAAGYVTAVNSLTGNISLSTPAMTWANLKDGVAVTASN